MLLSFKNQVTNKEINYGIIAFIYKFIPWIFVAIVLPINLILLFANYEKLLHRLIIFIFSVGFATTISFINVFIMFTLVRVLFFLHSKSVEYIFYPTHLEVVNSKGKIFKFIYIIIKFDEYKDIILLKCGTKHLYVISKGTLTDDQYLTFRKILLTEREL